MYQRRISATKGKGILMIEFNPKFSIAKLSAVELGSLVQLGDNYGFCAHTQASPSQTKSLALYNAEKGRFEYQEGSNPEVVDFGNKIIIAPTFETYVSSEEEVPDATDNLFMVDGKKPSISLRSLNSFFFLDLNSGHLTEINRKIWAGRFVEWRAGVRNADGQFCCLLHVKLHPGPAFS